jgi:hypothetical protein
MAQDIRASTPAWDPCLKLTKERTGDRRESRGPFEFTGGRIVQVLDVEREPAAAMARD